MKRISGLISVRETGHGVPNLVVKVLDSDFTIDQLRKKGLGWAFNTKHLKGLSSALTDSAGRFDVPAKSLEGVNDGGRPDLLLVVHAPADARDDRYARRLQDLVLYVSTVPRLKTLAEDFHAIRLRQEQLTKFGIRPEISRPSAETADAVSESALRPLDIRDDMRQRLASRVLEERKTHSGAREIAKSKLRHFNALPPTLEDDKARKRAMVIPDAARLSEMLPTLQEASITQGLKRLKQSAYRPTMQLRLSRADLRRLKIKISKKGRISGRLTSKTLRSLLQTKVNVLDMVRTTSNDLSLDDLERRYLTTEPPAPAVTTKIKQPKKRAKAKKARTTSQRRQR